MDIKNFIIFFVTFWIFQVKLKSGSNKVKVSFYLVDKLHS